LTSSIMLLKHSLLDHPVHPFPLKFNSKVPFPVSLFYKFCLLDQTIAVVSLFFMNFKFQLISKISILTLFLLFLPLTTSQKISNLILGFCFSFAL